MALKALAEFQAKNNETLMSGLNSVANDQVEPSVKIVLELKQKIDDQVSLVMQPLNTFSVQGSMALFALS